jgi:hypothetical protein
MSFRAVPGTRIGDYVEAFASLDAKLFLPVVDSLLEQAVSRSS